jgi:hypothetical protein
LLTIESKELNGFFVPHALRQDAVTGAADAILFERARALLLGGAAFDEPG